MDFLRPVKFWIWFGTVTSLAGWTLSAIHQLNRTGYILFFTAALLLFFLTNKFYADKKTSVENPWRKFVHRFRRPLPGAFAVLTILIFLGGVLYPPTNHTAFTYRLPRVLNWLAHEGWFWIHTPDWRLNDRACGIEWIAAPLVLFTHSDRGMFLLNFIPFLMLPGLFFSICVQLGVRARTAWHWMWILPTGYSFLLQAGSAGNDIFPTIYALAALAFGLRAWKSRQVSDLWHSILAAGLLTGAKATNIPLGLPWAILICPLLPLLLVRRASGERESAEVRGLGRGIISAGIVATAATVSFLPTAVLNHLHCGDWSGAVLEPAGETMHSPIIGLGGNTFQILLDNFCPPLFPVAGWWNQNAPRLLPHGFVTLIENNFDIGYFWLGELPTEDWAGIGFGVSVLLAISLVGAFLNRAGTRTTDDQKFSGPRIIRLLVLFTPWIAMLVYCVKSGLVTAARLISPYYFLLWPSLILGAGQALIVRRRWWKFASWIVMFFAFVVLVLTPPRPLWPAQTILSAALKAKPNHRLLTRAYNVYAVYSIRSDPLAGVRPLLPSDLKVTGFLGTPDDIDISLWRTYGTKRVEHILLEDSRATIRSKGIEWAVVSGLHLDQRKTTLAEWLAQSGAELVTTTNITVKVSDGPQPWHVVRFRNTAR